MSEPLRGVVVSHAALAEALVAAVRTISGVDGVLEAVSNEGCDPEALSARIDKALGKGPAVLFVDLPGGSCLTSALRMSRGRPTVAIVTGVNLAMLLDFVFHRDLSPAEAARRAAQAGGNAIRTPGAPAAPAAPAA
jgi:mannose/fructose-specific phosphotransferase system component IIA